MIADESDEVVLAQVTTLKSPPLPSGNPGCRCASTALEDDDGVKLKFAEVTLTVFTDCPDHGHFVDDIMGSVIEKLSVKMTGPQPVVTE